MRWCSWVGFSACEAPRTSGEWCRPARLAPYSRAAGTYPQTRKSRRAPGKGATALVLARPVRGCRGGERAVLGAGLEDPEGRIYGGVVPCIFVVRVRQVVTVWRPIR